MSQTQFPEDDSRIIERDGDRIDAETGEVVGAVGGDTELAEAAEAAEALQNADAFDDVSGTLEREAEASGVDLDDPAAFLEWYARVQRSVETELAVITAQHERLKRAQERRAEYLEWRYGDRALREARAMIESKKGKARYVDLPTCRVALRKKPDQLAVVDERFVRMFAEAHPDIAGAAWYEKPAVVIPAEWRVDRTALKKALKAYAVANNCEYPEGLALLPGGDEVKFD